MLVGLWWIPLHARNTAVVQTILELACAEIEMVRPNDVPADDDREIFVTAWCLHPRFTRSRTSPTPSRPPWQSFQAYATLFGSVW